MESDERGKTSPTKVGLAPTQRDGIEYEFTLMLDVDLNHRASVGKTRAELMADRSFSPEQTVEAAQMFKGWLESGVLLIDRNTADRLQQSIATLTPDQRGRLLTEWQVYRLFDARRGAWATFQYLLRERLLDEGARVAPDGSVS